MLVKAILTFGIYGKFGIGFEISDEDMQKLRNVDFGNSHDTADAIKEVVIENVIAMRSTIENLNKDFNYSRLINIKVDRINISGDEIMCRMHNKEQLLSKKVKVLKHA
jgi:hypothetical protein